MSTNNKIVWTRRKSKRTIAPVLLARRISAEWLASSFDTVSVRFQGPLLSSLMDLRDAAKQSKKNLPIGSLRLMLQATISGVISVDRNLGCDTGKTTEPAVVMYRSEEDDKAISGEISDQLSGWFKNTLEPWAHREGLDAPAARIKAHISTEHILLTQAQQFLCDPKTGRPNFAVIARQIGDRLAGETLFSGMGPCEIVLPEYGGSSSLDLMTPPRRAARGNTSFSMVARITVSTVPYSSDLYFTASAAKRVWAEKMPDGGNTGAMATAYVIAPNRPGIPVTVRKKKTGDTWGWDFDEDYAALYFESNSQLPATLEHTFQNIAHIEDSWWVGLPQITRLYRRVASRTVFESDESDLLDTIEPKLAGLIAGPVEFTSHRLVLNNKPRSAMLKSEDFGAAGAAIAEDPEEEDETTETHEEKKVTESEDKEREAVAEFRDQCIAALKKIHGNAVPHLWVIGGTEREQKYIQRAAELLFGEAIGVSLDPLPADVHGLRADLPMKDQKSRQRFEARVQAWTHCALPAAIARYRGPKFVLICAAKDLNRKSEDPVNRRAAIHAICSIAGASVHHVLPIEATTSESRAEKATQSFIHRAQSAMMDVVLAHSGYIIGADEFVGGQLNAAIRPKAIYGIQALRKKAQKFSGETPVCMVIYSRLVLATNITEIQFGYKANNTSKRSPWMRLADGLIWLGSQRQMQGDEDWLKQEFQKQTLDLLKEVNADDPRAIVFIDWQTLPSLWYNLSDANLTTSGRLKMGHLDLAVVFPLMSFVRLRYGLQSPMALRAWSETVYEGFREETSRTATGEFYKDGYVTTKKQLVSINPPATVPWCHRHFVGVMSYRKTTQITRGQSCYRPMVRMRGQEGEDKGVFEKSTLDPADTDAALPSSMDITVMHVPEGVMPVDVAILSMGLRLGYAHYDDWTRLPAPLFFERKIDDYIIKFPAGEGDAGEVIEGESTVVAPAEPQDEVDELPESEGAAPVMQLMVEMVEKELRPSSQENGSVIEVTESEADTATELVTPANEEPSAPLVATSDYSAGTNAEILARAKSIEYEKLYIYPPKNPKVRRLYEAMARNTVTILVDLPYFVETKGLLGKNEPHMKKRIKRAWKQLTDFGYASTFWKTRPTNEAFLDWMSAKLIHPQGAYLIDCEVLFDRKIIIPAAQDAINRYNATAEDRVELQRREGAPYIDLSPVVKKALDDADDDTLAWLIFAAAQTPNFGFAETIIPSVIEVIGPKTQAALIYYINCAIACERALAQIDDVKGGKFKAIHIERHFHEDSRPLESGLERKDGEAAVIIDETTKMKSDLLANIGKMNPGSSTFDEELDVVNKILGALKLADEAHRLVAREAEVRQQLSQVARKTAESVLETLRKIDEEHVLGTVRYVEPPQEQWAQLGDDVKAVEASVTDLVTAKSEMDGFYDQPLPAKASMSDRAKHARQATALFDSFNEGLATVGRALRASCCFVMDSPEPTAPPAPPDSPEPIQTEGRNTRTDKVPSVPSFPEITSAVPAGTVEPVPVAIPEPDTDMDMDLETEHSPAAPLPEPEVAPKDVDEPAPAAPQVAVVAAPAAPAAITEIPVVSGAPVREKPVEPLSHAPAAVTAPALTALIDSHKAGLIQKAFEQLINLVNRRHYALASTYVAATREAFSGPEINMHCVILSALCDAMESIDCHFAVDTRLNRDLREMLQAHTIEGGTFAGPPCSALGVLAASLVSMLFSAPATDTDDVRWAVIDRIRHPLTGLKAQSNLVTHIGTMDSKRIVLTREMFSNSRIGYKLAQQAEVKRSIERAINWKTDSSMHSSWSHQGFLRMHEYIYGIGHPIGQCLALIAKGDFKYLRQAYEVARRKFEKPSSTVIEAFKASGERSKPDGRYNVNACENISITENFIKECLARAEASAGIDVDLAKNEREFLDTLANLLTASINEVEALRCEHTLDYAYTRLALVVFKAVLRLFDEVPSAYCVPETQQRLLIQLPMDKAFMPSMEASEESGARALCSAEDVMHVIDELLDEDLSALPDHLTETDLMPLLCEALRLHVEERRFLPAFAIAAVPGVTIRLEQPLFQQYQKAKADLARELQDARQRVTHAMALSALDQREATNLLRIIESLNTSNTGEKAIGHPDGFSSAYPDFPHALAALSTQVLQVLDTQLKETRDKLLTDLQKFVDDHGNDAERDVNRIREMLAMNNPASLRTAHDACTILRNGGKLPSYSLSPGMTAPKEYEGFLASLDELRGNQVLMDELQERLCAPHEAKDVKCLKHLTPEQCSEAADFIQKWKDLCVERSRPAAAELAGKFFSSLGILPPVYMHETTRNTRYARLSFAEKAFGALITNDCFVPPALGSLTMGVTGFVIPGNQPDNDIASLVQDVAGVPTVILARTRLTLSKRARLSGQAPVILIDDNLIAYMALHPDDRARRMMEIGTLTFHTQPYSADGTSVPKEMFFGRQRELNSLRQVKSLAILYGGRRLGKSSLLAQIEREMNNVADAVAIYMPMNRDYHGGDYVTFAWRTLARALASRGIIEPLQKDETNWVPIRNWVEQQLTAPSQKIKSCYLLFDEADDLMGRELDLNPGATGLIASLHQMVESIQSKINIRYVIAGLHNLTRMTTESNSALGKAEVIALEPFSTDDDILRGIQLITKPMAALGFYFGPGSEDLPLRILSICNYYPAFIQVYCKKLLEHMYNKRPKDQAIAYVEAGDLDAVEKDHDLLTELQTKFGWTLDLDKRYKAIALILADVYYSGVETGKTEGLTVGEIREFCHMVAEAHFKGMSAGAYESLVDEMRKLNVLEKNGSSYRLRNPSIAMLIGDRERINHQLKVLAGEPPEQTRNHGDRRTSMEYGSAHLLFPMPIAWTTSHMDVIDGGLVILAGNNLSGLSDLCGSSTDWSLTQNGMFRAINMPVTSASTVVDKYRRQAGAGAIKGVKHLLASTPTSWNAGNINSFSNLAMKASAYRIRLALIALPDRLWEIALALRAKSLKVTSKMSWEVVPVPPWSMDAVRFHLYENAAVADNVEACSAIIDASGGFGKIIQFVCSGNLTHEAAMKSPKLAHEHFAPDLATFYKKIGMPEAIDADLRKRMEEFMVLVNNEKRGEPVVDESLQSCGLVQEDLLFLNWIGLLQENNDNTWRVPALYMQLIS